MRSQRLDAVTARFLVEHNGLCARVASLGHFSRSFICRVASGVKPPSAAFLRALDFALSEYILSGAQARLYRAILRHTHPEIDSESLISKPYQR
jgi:hypothetical protein